MPDDITTDQGDAAQAAVAEQGPDFEAEFEAGMEDEPQDQGEGGQAADAAADSGKGQSQDKDKGEGEDKEAPAGEGGDAESGGALAAIMAKAEAEEKAAAAAAATGGQKGQPGQEQGQGRKEGQDQGGGDGKPAKMTRETAAMYLDFFGDILPDEPILVGDKEVNIKALEEDLPGISDAIRIGSGRAANKLVRHLAETGDIVTGAAMREVVERVLAPMQEQLDEMIFWHNVNMQDSGAIQTIHSKEMKDWIATLPAPVQRRAKAISSPQDAIDFVKAFRESTAKAAAEAHDKKSRKSLERSKALHSDGAGGRRQPAPKGDGKGSFDDGFGEA